MIAIAAVALATGKFTMLVSAVTGVALLPVSARMWTGDRRRVERAPAQRTSAPSRADQAGWGCARLTRSAAASGSSSAALTAAQIGGTVCVLRDLLHHSA
jgi:hypothetical protein